MQTLKPFINGQFVESVSEKYHQVFDPSTGEMIARVPCCTREEMEGAIAAAKAAYPAWSATPVRKRAQLMLKLRELIVRDMDALTLLCAGEHLRTITVEGGDGATVDAVLTADLTGLVPENVLPQVEINLPDSLTAPVHLGDVLGTVRMVCQGETLCEVTLVAADSIRRDDFPARWKRYWQNWLLLGQPGA